jgi:hypothetical protein
VVFLSEDLVAAEDAARLAGPEVGRRLSIVTDWGTPRADQFDVEQPTSVASRAYRVGSTPLSLLLDPVGREIQRGLPLDAENLDNLKLRLDAVIRGDYSPPEPLPGS